MQNLKNKGLPACARLSGHYPSKDWSPHAESNALNELFFDANYSGNDRIGRMIVDAEPCGRFCVRDVSTLSGQIQDGVRANQLSSLNMSFKPGSRFPTGQLQIPR